MSPAFEMVLPAGISIASTTGKDAKKGETCRVEWDFTGESFPVSWRRRQNTFLLWYEDVWCDMLKGIPASPFHFEMSIRTYDDQNFQPSCRGVKR